MTQPEAIEKSVHWVLGEPDIFLNSVGDVDVLPMVLKAANKLMPKPSNKAMKMLAEEQGIVSIFGI